jgi:hypothetical protein
MKITFTKISNKFSHYPKYEVQFNGVAIGVVENQKSGRYNNWHVLETVKGRIAKTCESHENRTPDTIADVAHSTRKDAVAALCKANGITI